MRGGNYIPPEMSLARTNRDTYEKIKNYALFARFNMIRLWGGGQFEKNEFYDLMDEAGILIWHDLMFACALYPSSSDILANIEA
jgi:beta-mannosidase